MTPETTYYLSPVGWLKITADEEGLLQLVFASDEKLHADTSPMNPHLISCISQLDEYFNKSRTSFDLSLKPVGTPFQQDVWNLLLEIPYGETRTYSQLAGMLNKPGAVRAVGNANSRNRIAIIIPCHRVIGTDGSLTGFTGGIEIKRRLLDHEKACIQTVLDL